MINVSSHRQCTRSKTIQSIMSKDHSTPEEVRQNSCAVVSLHRLEEGFQFLNVAKNQILAIPKSLFC